MEGAANYVRIRTDADGFAFHPLKSVTALFSSPNVTSSFSDSSLSPRGPACLIYDFTLLLFFIRRLCFAMLTEIGTANIPGDV